MKCEAKNQCCREQGQKDISQSMCIHINEAKGCLKASDSRRKASEDTTGKLLMLLKLCQAAICIFCLQKGNAVLIHFYLLF